MIKIGITGQNGFIGKNLYNTIGLNPKKYKRVFFEKSFFDNESKLDEFILSCDVVIHLAGINRHYNDKFIFKKNIELAEKLISSLNRTNSNVHLIFSSSTQEFNDNSYGKSKKIAREMFSEWSKSSGCKFTGLIIPNVFGPFGNPNYNSVVSTFCHQLTHNIQTKLNVDNHLFLIYVFELVEKILDSITLDSNYCLKINHTHQIKVSELLLLLNNFKEKYFDNGIIPIFNNKFELDLFNTFRSYIDLSKYYPVIFDNNKDSRGSFVEIIRLNTGGQVSFSTTLPGITRGNHFHTRKIERFAVIKGKALIQLRQIGTTKKIEFYLDGENSSYIDMPIWFTHNIKNIGNEELFTIFWINEFYNPRDTDTFMETV